MNKTKHQTKAAKARRKWQLLQDEQKLLEKKDSFEERTIPLKVAHKRQKSSETLADSA